MQNSLTNLEVAKSYIAVTEATIRASNCLETGVPRIPLDDVRVLAKWCEENPKGFIENQTTQQIKLRLRVMVWVAKLDNQLTFPDKTLETLIN